MSQQSYILLQDNINSANDNEMSQSNVSDSIVEELNSPTIPPATMKPKTSRTHVLFENLTTIIHLVIVQLVLLIWYLCFSNNIELFTWHPVFMSLGWLLMLEAILIMSNDNCLTTFVQLRNRSLVHWVLQTAAVISVLIGFCVIYTNKNLKGKEHFHTWHGSMGLVVLICLLPTCVLGAFTKYKIDLRRFVKPVVNKTCHFVSGVVSLLFVSLTMLLSLYSHWFTKQASFTMQLLCFIAILVATAWTLRRPIQFLIGR